MEEFAYALRIPKERVAVLIGKNGDVKKRLEQSTGTSLKIDSEEGEVVISGKDALQLYTTREIVLAVGRGFNPEIAQLLLKQDYGIEIINIQDYAKTQNDLIRLRGRVIGEDGKSRRTVEELTETSISVFGKTVGIIGELEFIPLARKAIESLLTGSPHSTVYHWLERKRKELRRKAML